MLLCQRKLLELAGCVYFLAWTLAVCSVHSDWDLAAVEHAEKFSARNIANTLWALAKMMHDPGDAFLNSLGAEAGKKVTDFNAQNHANTVWAFATLGEQLM